MINSRTKDLVEAKKIAGQVKKKINSTYKELEIELDGIFATMLLLTKKKYAALVVNGTNPDGTINTTKEVKGTYLLWHFQNFQFFGFFLRQHYFGFECDPGLN